MAAPRKTFKQVVERFETFCELNPDVPRAKLQLAEGNLGGCFLYLLQEHGGTTPIISTDTFGEMYAEFDMGRVYDRIVSSLRRHYGMGISVDESRITRAIGEECLWTGVWAHGNLKFIQPRQAKIVAISLETKTKYTSPVERTQVVRVVYDVMILDLGNMVVPDVAAEHLLDKVVSHG